MDESKGEEELDSLVAEASPRALLWAHSFA
jgi:hypothetical protein